MMEKVSVPDIGSAADVEVIEILVKKGDRVSKDESLVVLESDKASMEIPSPVSGIIDTIEVKVGDQVDEGDAILVIAVESSDASPVKGNATEAVSKHEKKAAEDSRAALQATPDKPETAKEPAPVSAADPGTETASAESAEDVHAGPSVRKQAREYGVELGQIKGSGKFGRILKEDVVAHIKNRLSDRSGGQTGTGIPQIPPIDFAKFGEIEVLPRSRIRQAGARNLHRSWLNIPHVTQFDKADITDLEQFRREQNLKLGSRGIKLTPLAFLIRASVSALQAFPQFNSSLAADGEHLIIKKYIHIGIAVETDEGLVVPVLRNADKKGLIKIASEAAELALQAREKRLKLDAQQGASFSISSLGGIGGTAFTPIVNAPEVAILGVSRTAIEPVYDGSKFEPRTLLPLSLSYDHRVIDGAEAARFTNYLSQVLSDTRMMLL